MLMTTDRSCGCRGCSQVIRAGVRISWIEGIGPYHIHCSPSQKDKELVASEKEDVKRQSAQLGPTPKGISKYLNRLVTGVIALVIIWFLVGGRISYAVSECSNGVGRCLVGIAVAVGIVDVYDKRDRCIGVGCNY